MEAINKFKSILESNPEIISNYMYIHHFFQSYISSPNDKNILHKQIYDLFTRENVFIKDVTLDILLDSNKCTKLIQAIKENIKI